MKGKKIKVKAKKSNVPFFNEGDTLYIQSILYDKPHTLVREMASYYHKDNPENARLGPITAKLAGKPIGTVEKYNDNSGRMVMKSCDATIAPRGSYKSGLIITEDGREYPDSIIGHKTFQEVFEKV